MKKFALLKISTLCLALFLLFTACDKNSTGNDDEKTPPFAEFVTEWNASEFVMSSNSNPSVKEDLVKLGISFYMVIDEDKNYNTVLTIPGDPRIIETGTVTVEGNKMYVKPHDEDGYVMTYTLTGNTLTLVFPEDEFDFNDTGIAVSVTRTIVLWKADADAGNLVAYLPFNGNTQDESNYPNRITVHGGSLTEDRFGNENGAYKFNGQDEYISVLKTSFLSSDEITISAWVKYRELAWDWMDIVSYGIGGYVLAVTETSHLIGGLQFSYNCEYECTTDMVNDDWYFVALTKSSDNQYKVFVNGDEEASGTFNVGPSFIRNINVGRDPFGGEYFNGSIDEVRIYNETLLPSEILALYETE